jgi:membrane protease YdiL (CAAX protease family)
VFSYENSNDESPASAPEAGPPWRKPSCLEAIFVGPQGVRAGWRMLLFIVLWLVSIAILESFEHLILVALSLHVGTFSAGVFFAQEIVLAGAAVAATVVMSRVERRPFGDYGMPLRGAFGGRFWQGAIWGVGQITAIMLLIAALGGYSFGGLAMNGEALLRYAVEWAGVFFLVGVFEEFFFRGYLQFTLASATHFWVAATFTSLLFGAVHLGNPGEGPIGAVSVFVIGMFLCFTLRRTGNLWFAIGWHAAFDFGETYLYAVPNSGIVMQGHLLAASVRGPRWVTGGSVGPEGSVAAFVAVALAFVAFDRVYRVRADRPETQVTET